LTFFFFFFTPRLAGFGVSLGASLTLLVTNFLVPFSSNLIVV
jgi:hypothetical protein